MPRPPEVAMPSTEEFLLPQRAYLLAYKTQAVTARRAALKDSYAHFKEVAGSDSRHEAQLGLLGLIGDAMQAVEDVGNLGSSMIEGLEGLASYVKATVYDPSHVNNFFAQMHKRDLSYFLRLCAFRFGEFTMFDFFGMEPPLSDVEKTAFAAAEEATASLVGEHLVSLASEWERYRRFFHAYKHAALVANPDDVEILTEAGEPVEGIIVWARRRREAEIGNHATGDLVDIADHIESVGKLAIDMIGYLVETRLGIFDALKFEDDGSVTIVPLQGSPWEFWMRREDVGVENIELLAGRGIVLAGPDLTGTSMN